MPLTTQTVGWNTLSPGAFARRLRCSSVGERCWRCPFFTPRRQPNNLATNRIPPRRLRSGKQALSPAPGLASWNLPGGRRSDPSRAAFAFSHVQFPVNRRPVTKIFFGAAFQMKGEPGEHTARKRLFLGVVPTFKLTLLNERRVGAVGSFVEFPFKKGHHLHRAESILAIRHRQRAHDLIAIG